jgi:hypothetical protein
LSGEEEEEEDWWLLDQVATSSHLVKIVHDKDINDSQGQDQEELMMKYISRL